MSPVGLFSVGLFSRIPISCTFFALFLQILTDFTCYSFKTVHNKSKTHLIKHTQIYAKKENTSVVQVCSTDIIIGEVSHYIIYIYYTYLLPGNSSSLV